MNIKPFTYLRMPNVALGGAWEQLKGTTPTWGGIIFPSSAIQMECVKTGGLLEVQETFAAEKTFTYEFRRGAIIVILGNTLLYFDDNLIGKTAGRLEDYNQKS